MENVWFRYAEHFHQEHFTPLFQLLWRFSGLSRVNATLAYRRSHGKIAGVGFFFFFLDLLLLLILTNFGVADRMVKSVIGSEAWKWRKIAFANLLM